VRFITFNKDGLETVGVRFGQEIVDLSVAAPNLPRTLVEIIQAEKLEEAGRIAEGAGVSARRPLTGIEYLPLIPHPPKFFGFGINYPSHAGERPKTPGFFLSGPQRFCAHDEPMLIPPDSRTLDYEIELALVIGKTARRVSAAKALDHIAGYTIFNDASVRGRGGGMTLALMKNADKTGPLGPELVTPDELPLGCDGLKLITRRNGIIVQNDTTASMYWKVPEVIELSSKYLTLEPGDVVCTGTCGGTVVDTHTVKGAGMDSEELPYLKPGDVVECEIEGIGVLRNSVSSDDR
jgi:acylpyruvate hydrolase